MESTTSSQKIKMTSKDGKVITADAEVLKLGKFFADMLDKENDDEEDSETIEIKLETIDGEILEKVVAFCKHYKEEPMKEFEKPLKSSDAKDLVQAWYAEFLKVENETLYAMIAAANFLNVQPMLDLTCASIAMMIRGKSGDDIRATFNLGELSEEEKARRAEEDRWCEEAS